MATLTFTEV